MTEICELKQLEEKWTTGHQKILRRLHIMPLQAFADVSSDVYDVVVHVRVKLKTLLRTNIGASGEFEGLVTSKQGRGNLREKLLASLVTRVEHLVIARGYETRLSSFLNVLSKMDNRRGLQD